MSYCVYDIKSVNNLQMVEYLRIFRNECRLYMTNNTNEISSSEQKIWFENLNPAIKPYLFYINDDPIGYGVAYICEDVTTISCGLSSKFRNNGIGRELIRLIISVCPTKIVRLDVLKSNIRAIKLYSALDFISVDENENIISMEYYK